MLSTIIPPKSIPEKIAIVSQKIALFLFSISDVKDKNIKWDQYDELITEAQKLLKNPGSFASDLEIDFRAFLSAAYEYSIGFITLKELRFSFEDLIEHFSKKERMKIKKDLSLN